MLFQALLLDNVYGGEWSVPCTDVYGYAVEINVPEIFDTGIILL